MLLEKVLGQELLSGTWLWCLHPALPEWALSLACWNQSTSFLTPGNLVSSCQIVAYLRWIPGKEFTPWNLADATNQGSFSLVGLFEPHWSDF